MPRSIESKSRGEVLGPFGVSVRDSDAAVELDLRFVDRVARVRVQHLVAWVHHGEDELADGRLASRLHHNVLRRVRRVVRGGHVGGKCLSQLRNTGVGAIARLAVGDRLERGFDHGRGRREVDVAKVERVYPVSLGAKCSGLARHRKGGLGPEVGDTVGYAHVDGLLASSDLLR